MKNQIKLLILTCTIVLSFFCCRHGNKSQSFPENNDKRKFSIHGIIRGIDSDWIIICHSDRPEKDIKIDSVKIIDGKFKINGELLNGPEPFLLGLRHKESNGTRSWIMYYGPFILDSGNLNIEGSKNSLNNLHAWGTQGQDEYNAFKQKINPLDKVMNKISDQIYAPQKGSMKLLDSLDKAFRQSESQIKSVVTNHVKQYPSSVISAYIVKSFLSNPDRETIKPIYELFTPNVKNSKFGKQVFEELQASNRVAIATPAYNFSLPNMEDKLVSLSSYKGKYVLVDFWASWCGPCRQENLSLVKTYDSFKKQGFEIIGISIDDNKKSWLSAVQQGNLSWVQLLDSKNKIGDIYGVTAIPMNFLVDKSGKIIASNLKGGELQKKLEEVIHK